MSVEQKHKTGIQLYSEGNFEAACTALGDALDEEATSELASDWAAAQFACGRLVEAEAGFRRSLQLDAANVQAAANLGALLACAKRANEAIPFLESATSHPDENQRTTIKQLLSACRMKVASDAISQSQAAFRTMISDLHPNMPAPTPVVARPPVYVGNNLALLCTTFHRMMYVDTRDLLIAPRLLMQGEWEPEETAVFTRIFKRGSIFVDVGANIGYYSLLAAGQGASRVYAFEAQRSTFELLGKNVIINWMNKIVHCEHLAVYSHSTDLDFFVRNSYPGNSSIGECSFEQLAPWFDTSEKVSVHAVSLDDYFFDKQPKIDLLKVDVEGAEPSVFEGARNILRLNPDIQILCEWSPDQMATARQRPEQLVKLWKEHKLRAFSIHTGLQEVNLDTLASGGYQNLLLHR